MAITQWVWLADMTKSVNDRPPPGQGADPSLPWLLRRVNQRYRAAIWEGLAAAGFTDIAQTGFWAIDALAPGISDASQPGAEMRVTKQAVSKIVEALVAGGYLERRTNDRDRRKTDLTLTPRGRRAAQVIGEAVAATDRQYQGALGESGFRPGEPRAGGPSLRARVPLGARCRLT